ncbi:unnamed protein product, partial [Owenia fusiformis]
EWSKISTAPCSVTCGGGTQLETWERRYINEGEACNGTEEDTRTATCNIETCPCEWGEFSEWEGGNCTEDCLIIEQRTRNYGGGENCPSDTETETRTVECTKSPCRRVSCDFEPSSSCGYTDDSNTGNVWLANRGTTPTSYTGPDADHTSGESDGTYIYMEGNDMLSGAAIRIATPIFESYGTSCLSFWYHMKGYYIGSLSIYVEDEASSMFSLDQKVWSSFGHRGVLWNYAYIDIENRSSFRAVFEAIRGPAINSDIAIDDINIKEGPCEVTDNDVTCDFEDQYL